MSDTDLFKKIISHSKEYGFVYPSSEIYEGLTAVYDYGQLGVELKNNLKQYWWQSMVQMHPNIVGLDSAILMHPTVWKASGHVDAFCDPLIDSKDSKKRYRADVLIEDHISKLRQKVDIAVEEARKRYGEEFDEATYLQTNERTKTRLEKIEAIEGRLVAAMQGNHLSEIKKIIEDEGIACPVSGSKNWTDVRQFNLMFSTQMGAMQEGANTLYLRPETAQGIFVNFLNVQKSSRQKLPMGIAQIGKAFRNEIVARQFIFRMKEFEQMEMQYFVTPGTEKEAYEQWKSKRLQWHKKLGLGEHLYRYHDHANLAHYANAACDIEFSFPFGYKELEGIHSRTDFDLKSHEQHSGKKMQYFDPEKQSSYTPYVVETSIGLDRLFLAVLSASYQEQKLDNDNVRIYLKIPKEIAPIKAAILPLVKKDGLSEKAQNLYDICKKKTQVVYDEKDSIGKRYRRQDAIGTPYCITLDHQTLEDDTVTWRDRDSLVQERVHIDSIADKIAKDTHISNLL